jgi:AhpD family alkylhydroperoxidase
MSRPFIAHRTLVPELYQKLLELSQLLKKSSLGTRLVELVFLRVSQINGCAYCLDMHTRGLLEAGEEPQRLHTLAGWRETAFFTERERAALDWAERVTEIRDVDALDASAAALPRYFKDDEIAQLTYAVGVINAWNRLAVALKAPVARASLPEKARRTA